ncbi:MAG: hypothetical protein ACRD1U_14530 [Vicinamibacterales bacterium]
MNRRPLAAWTARHDNGWVATVLETPNGLYSAWVGREGEAISVDYVEDSPEHAQIAAEFALKQRTGHAQCSAQCSGWLLHTHEFIITDGTEREQ